MAQHKDKHDHPHHDHKHEEDHVGDDHSGHAHGKNSSRNVLLIALFCTLGFSFVEAIGGWVSHSLALISDAGHMFSDALSLGLAALAAQLAKRPVSSSHSYGLVRAEVIAASVNGLLMLGVIIYIVVEAVKRLQAPEPVAGFSVMVIAFIGLLVNIFVAYMFSRGESNLNTRAALLHVMGDLLGSVAALVAGAVIYFTGWMPIDPLLSIFVALLILVSTLNLLREALHVLMEGVPRHLDLQVIGDRMAKTPDVNSVHDLHIWTLASGQVALSSHISLINMNNWSNTLESIRLMLRREYDIEHVTLQPESAQGITQPYTTKIPIHAVLLDKKSHQGHKH
ncbi:MAG: cation transporter [Pseudomonadota bacterium]|jgi:cobalt-zinc-cadmium efflux system protein